MSRASIAEIGRGLGQSFINAGEMYVKHKAEQSKVQQAQKKLDALKKTYDNPNSTDIEKVSAWADIDPKIAATVVLAGEKQKQKEQTQKFIADQYAQDFGIAPPPQITEAPEPAGLGGQQGKIVQPVNPEAATPTQPGFSPSAPQQAARNATELNQQVPIPIAGAPPMQQPQQLTPRQEAQRLRAKGGQMNTMQPGAGAPYLEQANSIEREEQKQREFGQKQEFEARKGNEKYRQELLKGIPATKKLKGQLNKLENLNKKELLTPAAVKTLNFFGVPLGVFDTANEQEFEKQALDLTANIQQDYGSRILQSEFNTYLRRIPTLLNSKEGRTRIIENIRIYADAKEAEQKAYIDLYKMQKDSGIQHPLVRQEDVLEYADKELNQIFDRLNQNLMEDTGVKEKAKLLPMVQQGSIRMVKDGRFYDFPAQQAELRQKEGFAPL